MSGTLNVYLT